MTPDQAFAEAVEQMPRRRTGNDTWSSRAVFWAAVRAGHDTLASPWEEASERWGRLWAVACDEHLPPIPGAAHIGAPPSQAVAASAISEMKSIVGITRGGTRVHR